MLHIYARRYVYSSCLNYGSATFMYAPTSGLSIIRDESDSGSA